MSDTSPAAPQPAKSHGHHWPIIIALILGILFGVVLQWAGKGGTPGWVDATLVGFKFISGLFLKLLKMVIVPLVVSAVIAGIAGLGTLHGFGRMGLRTVCYYVGTGLFAITMSLFVVNLVKPGTDRGKPSAQLAAALQANTKGDVQPELAAFKKNAEGGLSVIGDIFNRVVPENVVKAAADGEMIALIFFSILFAAAMVKFPGGTPQVLREFFEQVNEVMMVVTLWIMRIAPLGVFCLMSVAVAKSGLQLLADMSIWMFTVGLALALHLFVVLPIVISVFAGVNPWRHFRHMRDALLMAFSTASSSATMPVTFRCLRENAGVSARVSSFTVPLGTSVNMDGTALYECMSVVFVTQILGLDLSIGQQCSVVFLALLTGLGMAGIPSASMVAILIILKSVGLPDETALAAVGLLLAVDRPLDMVRTAVNVFSDSCAAVVVARGEGELQPAPVASFAGMEADPE